jgi:glucose/mannose-6-phosphate isomerase
MLDDLKMIHERDSKDILGTAGKIWQQLKHDFTIENGVEYRLERGLIQYPTDSADPLVLFAERIDNIVYAGMGSSALAAEISRSWPGYDVPFEVCRTYQPPRYVDKNTLFIASSYSGNSEETLSALQWAEGQTSNIVVIASGGAMVDLARQKKYPLIVLPAGLEGRQAVLYTLRALYTVLKVAGIDSSLHTAETCADWLSTAQANWLPTVATAQNQAKQIAQELAGKSVVVYSGPLLHPAAYKWKISINEYAKQVAWWGQYPEFNHNELMGWSKQPVVKPYAIIDIRSNLEHPQIQKRFELSERLLSGVRPSPVVVQAKGDSLLSQILYVYVLSEFVSIYLALLAGNDPSSADILHKFRKELA